MPGHKHVHERPDHPDGKYRKETVVLDNTEDFDIPGIGKFKTAVVQEEEYLDDVLTQRALNWFALDKTTNSVYAFGEVSWEIEEGKPIFGGSWRAGEPDGDGARRTRPVDARHVHDRRPLYIRRQPEHRPWRLRKHGSRHRNHGSGGDVQELCSGS